jgi:hypothetical protein
MTINWIKILANGGTAFFTTLVGILTMDSISNTQVSLQFTISAAILIGFIQAGLAICKELSMEAEPPNSGTVNPGCKIPRLKKGFISAFLNDAVLF